MKSFFAVLAILLLNTSFAKDLHCKSKERFEGWDGGNTNSIVLLKAKITNNGFVNLSITGAYSADFNGTLEGTPSKNWLRYKTLEDAWCWYTVTMPANFKTYSKPFVGFIDRVCEENTGLESIRLSCSVK